MHDKNNLNINLTKMKKLQCVEKEDNIAKKVLIGFGIFLIIVILVAVMFVSKINKEKENEKNLVGYILKEEQLVDSCNLVNMENYYLGKGILKGETRYIFQGEKNGQKTDNIDITDKDIEINYVSKDSTIEKPGTVKAFARTYIKRNKEGKVIKKQDRYFYKVYIPKDTIKDCGELSEPEDEEE